MYKDKAMELVAALRSGKYKQGVGYLAKEGKHCCLGVACELTPGLKVIQEEGEHLKQFGGNKRTSEMPEEVSTYFGFRSSVGSLAPGYTLRGHPTLTQANDVGVPFSEIADFIEQNWNVL